MSNTKLNRNPNSNPKTNLKPKINGTVPDISEFHSMKYLYRIQKLQTLETRRQLLLSRPHNVAQFEFSL